MSYPPEPPADPGRGPGDTPGYTPGYVPGYGPGPVQPYGPPGVAATNGKATAALVTGIASLVLSWCCGLGVAGVVAIVLGVKARREIAMSGGRQQGDGMALGGIITGAVAVVLGLLVLVLIAVAVVAGAEFQVDTGTTQGTEF
jgi:hypothetical protein